MAKRRIMLDTRSVIQIDPTITQRFWPARKQAGPAIPCERPWEEHGICHGTVLNDSGRFKAWYNVENNPPKENAFMVAYGESPDGLHWEKPDLGIQPFGAIKDTNLLAYIRMRPSVIIDPQEPDPDQRYKSCGHIDKVQALRERGLNYPGNGYYLAHSRDGLHWTEYPADRPIGTREDVGNFIRDEPRRRYFGTVKDYIRYDLIDRRSVVAVTSLDFHKWSEPKTILVPDALDDRIARELGFHHAEYYGMGLMAYEDFLVGFVWIFWAGLPLLPKSRRRTGWWGQIDVHLTFSYDGVYWFRTPDRRPFIALGENGDFDSSQIQTLSRPVIVGDEVWIYYTGNNKGHAYFDQVTATHIHEERPEIDWSAPKWRHTRAIGVARLKQDRYASLSTGTQGSFVVDHGVPDGKHLLVNARAPLGSIKAQVLDADQDPIPGFGIEECIAFTGDDIHGEIIWAGKSLADLPRENTICFRFVLDYADLFAYELTD